MNTLKIENILRDHFIYCNVYQIGNSNTVCVETYTNIDRNKCESIMSALGAAFLFEEVINDTINCYYEI